MRLFKKLLATAMAITMFGTVACTNSFAGTEMYMTSGGSGASGGGGGSASYTQGAIPTISVSSKTALAGSTVELTVSLANNPGIVSMLLNVSYDSSALTLTGVKDAGVLGTQSHSDNLGNNPYILYWNNGTATSNFTNNGTIATLTFKINDNAPDKDYPITISYDAEADAIFNLEFKPVYFETSAGKISVVKMICGDVNGDMRVTPLDTVILARYLAKWTGYDALPYVK